MGGRTNEQTGFDEEEVGVRGGERGKVVDLVERYAVSVHGAVLTDSR